MNKDLVYKIKELAKNIGFETCGITTTGPFEDYRKTIEKRVEQFPDSAGRYEKMLYRAEPAASRPWARSIIVCVKRYGVYKIPGELIGYIGRNYLCDRRYKGSPDYDMPKKMKQGLISLGCRVSRGGTPDRNAGARAGVTQFGKNTFAYSESGSWINIETYLVDKELPVDEPSLETTCPDDCTICIDACPTKALMEPFALNPDTCIAYLTYESKEPVPSDLWEKMGKWIYGCDICQEVCPLNKGKWENRKKIPWIDEVRSFLAPKALSEMSQETFQDIVRPRFWYIPLDNLFRWHRNAGRALAQKK